MNKELQIRGVKSERVIRECTAALLLLATALVLAARYSSLPRMIPSPFNGGAGVDGLGDKNQLWLVVFIQAFLYALMSVFNLFPNTGAAATASSEGASPSMALARVAMGWIKVLTMGVVLLLMVNLVN